MNFDITDNNLYNKVIQNNLDNLLKGLFNILSNNKEVSLNMQVLTTVSSFISYYFKTFI